jgi:periplasmic divalent cation tolerance protein
VENSYAVVITTAGSPEEAEKIAMALLDRKLAACIQVTQIKSYYFWEGKVNADPEQLLLIKCKAADYEAIESCIREVHSYDVPEVVQLPVTAGSSSYLKWITDVTK